MRQRLIDQLPEGLAVALRLHETGHDDGVIAAALDVPEQSVPTLLALAHAKLARLAGGAVESDSAEMQ